MLANRTRISSKSRHSVRPSPEYQCYTHESSKTTRFWCKTAENGRFNAVEAAVTVVGYRFTGGHRQAPADHISPPSTMVLRFFTAAFAALCLVFCWCPNAVVAARGQHACAGLDGSRLLIVRPIAGGSVAEHAVVFRCAPPKHMKTCYGCLIQGEPVVDAWSDAACEAPKVAVLDTQSVDQVRVGWQLGAQSRLSPTDYMYFFVVDGIR